MPIGSAAAATSSVYWVPPPKLVIGSPLESGIVTQSAPLEDALRFVQSPSISVKAASWSSRSASGASPTGDAGVYRIFGAGNAVNGQTAGIIVYAQHSC